MPLTSGYEDENISPQKTGYRELLQECVHASRKSSPEIFNNATMATLLDALWNVYFEQIFQIIFGLYAAVLGLCFVYTVLLGWERKGGGSQTRGILIVLDFLMLVAGVGNIFVEVKQLRLNSRDYLSDYWNIVHVVLYTMLILAAAFHYAEKDDAAVSLSSIAIVLAAFNTLFYFKGFKSMGGLVRMLEKIITELVWFIIVVVLILLSFSAAFYSMFEEESAVGYRTYWETLFTAFRMMIGDFETDEFEYASSPHLMVCLFIIYMFLMAIVMLNFIIAVLSETYEKVKESERAQMLFEKANIILELYHCLSEEDENFINRLKWVHVIAPEDQTAKTYRSVTTKDVMEKTSDNIDNLRKETLHAIQDQKHSMMEEMTKIVKKEITNLKEMKDMTEEEKHCSSTEKPVQIFSKTIVKQIKLCNERPQIMSTWKAKSRRSLSKNMTQEIPGSPLNKAMSLK